MLADVQSRKNGLRHVELAPFDQDSRWPSNSECHYSCCVCLRREQVSEPLLHQPASRGFRSDFYEVAAAAGGRDVVVEERDGARIFREARTLGT